MVVKKCGSQTLAEIPIDDLIGFISARVPGMALAVQVRDIGGGLDTQCHNSGNRPFVLGLALLCYRKAKQRSRQVFDPSKGPEPEVVRGEYDLTLTLNECTVELLCDFLTDHDSVEAIALGVAIPDDGDKATTMTYLHGNCASVRGLADLNLEVNEERAEGALEAVNEEDEDQETDADELDGAGN